jgi:long-chain acyl-CoA synthetase
MAEQKQQTFRLIYNPKGDAADILAYATGLIEGRVAGKYMLSGQSLPNSIVVQGVRRKGIIAGADIQVDAESASKHEIDVAKQPRSGRGGPKPSGSISFQDLMTKSSKKFKAAEVKPEDPAVLLYTSGTTGKPKGVTLTHKNFLTQCNTVVPAVFPMQPKDRPVLVLPLYHVYGLANGLVSGIFSATSMVLVPQYSPSALLEAIDRTKATVLIAIPSMYQHLLQLARARKTEIPKSLRTCISGGAPLPLSVLQDFEKIFQTTIAEGYGLTESTSAVCLNPSGNAHKDGSIGPPATGVEMTVFDENDSELPRGEVGEIVIKSDVVTPGYWNNPEATAESIKDGWFHTGDLGYQDEDGYFFITDRKKDLIIRGGFNISPREVEECIASHEKVVEAAVLSVGDKRDKEAVKAFVVLQEGSQATEREILEYCQANLAPYKVPKYVEFRESLPKSMTGKILRRELTGEFEDRRLIKSSEGGES